MSITGFILCLFILGHLIGNSLMFIGADIFNNYGHKLMSNPFIYVIEAILGIIFLTHVYNAIKLTIENYVARPEKYYMKVRSGRGATFASSTMIYTGSAILIFLIIHLINFKFGPVYIGTFDGTQMRDLHKLMLEFYQNKLNVIFYVGLMIVLAIHISHGVWSLCQSVGFNFDPYMKYIKIKAKFFAVLVAVGFSSYAIWASLQGGF
ncbi:MAG: hypothetical protein A2504_07870 [Bdellovibrionales bacterium RIFOXYD12_FULL_39_22]|nr:MAG: hypothetical protein A2385_11195 [Bdellovibrionales bacterium RIFOXYB1_FULL_39_21]OFZ41308.1 MAG: hypothetical protein A2485_00490 [Bdellovibrionales bacterium RIFOXYC12_FULL_39_17]OFZ45106.1 MAG: hypothetical protein A2404_11490 [Bdellovibrionales bacterium RIFOXYC1_FULL_39_130]OFZ72834.1 MAG: hypothetical protein A2451_10135 [Bdellovibrionales bacterium RIFOXYC2_FULL_39_8]OFZ74490.1 MAG: hypothetical protein A2560_11525 [Bdellovibrionales bacterium RIFOXYD1_FULL_39_84]OFZ92502.1 MAG: